ncbi:hypothetical protein PP175_25285 (plasmid) [Aneurinibacillus sp. Ricciae_BoGa-3]|uniref:hypothetical protein n=1 Tax=Aneurinibacillus sp. Ricciae_BoGa-3 TaxID=3022697 RepID=UPI00233FF4E7|nr:hypothetical protein [Aneurinibacillus sp. Ricciae_BoGa-3]WCK57383.1 hypothetical protein PP175_25285 [Aneurinibacillus sp. Ricciae_BoGa-3]
MVIEEMIHLFDEIKTEKIMDSALLSVLETLLLGLDFLTHEKLINTPFQISHRDRIQEILKECFEKNKAPRFLP